MRGSFGEDLVRPFLSMVLGRFRAPTPVTAALLRVELLQLREKALAKVLRSPEPSPLEVFGQGQIVHLGIALLRPNETVEPVDEAPPTRDRVGFSEEIQARFRR